jgi:rRNA maturation endonuclease Nob1
MLRVSLPVRIPLSSLSYLNFISPPVIQGAKKTGDYAVLSHPDLCVLALTYSLHKREEAAAVKLANEARFAFVCK